jgi:hypothetical protein
MQPGGCYRVCDDEGNLLGEGGRSFRACLCLKGLTLRLFLTLVQNNNNQKAVVFLAMS